MCPHTCKHTYVRTHAYHIHAQEAVRGRETPFLHFGAFLGLTSIRLNLFFYCVFCVTTQHWLDTEKGPSPTRVTRKQTESPRPLLGPGTATVAWWCGQKVRARGAGFAPRRNGTPSSACFRCPSLTRDWPAGAEGPLALHQCSYGH